MANEPKRLTRREHSYRIITDRKNFRQPSVVVEANRIASEHGITLDEARDKVLADRRQYARLLDEEAQARRLGLKGVGKPIDPAGLTTPELEEAKAEFKAERRKAQLRNEEKERRISILTELVISRGDAFAAFIVILESKGLPAHIIDEQKLAMIVNEERWDMVPQVLAWLIREDNEVKQAFKVFSDAAKKCMENLRTGSAKAANNRAAEILSERYRSVFLQAASIYARKLATLEVSLDRLSTLTLDELDSLVADGDELSTRLAAIGMKISAEIKRRESKKGAAAKSEKLEPVRQFALKLANDGGYPSRRQAVLAIKADVIKYAKSLDGVSMSEHQAATTIDGWLKNLGYTPSAGKQGMPAG